MNDPTTYITHVLHDMKTFMTYSTAHRKDTPHMYVPIIHMGSNPTLTDRADYYDVFAIVTYQHNVPTLSRLTRLLISSGAFREGRGAHKGHIRIEGCHFSKEDKIVQALQPYAPEGVTLIPSLY